MPLMPLMPRRAHALQALCGVAAGCTKTSITSHFALKANMADISAKENAQETAVNVCGMVSVWTGVLLLSFPSFFPSFLPCVLRPQLDASVAPWPLLHCYIERTHRAQ